MKPKKKTAGKSEKRKFHPLRQQIEFWFIGLFLLSMVITTVINGLFLEHYYISKKTDVLQEAVKNLEALKMTTDSDGKCSADISDEMFKDEFRLFLPWVYYLCICNLYILYNDSIYHKSCEIQEIWQPDFVCCKGSEFYLSNDVDFRITDSDDLPFFKKWRSLSKNDEYDYWWLRIRHCYSNCRIYASAQQKNQKGCEIN